MAHEVKLTMDGLLINWLKEVGDAVSASDVIAEFEADKATVEIEAGSAGQLLELRAEPGDELGEGTVIALIGAAGESAATAGKTLTPGSGRSSATEASRRPAPTNGQTMTADGRIKASPLGAPHRRGQGHRPQPRARHRARWPHRQVRCREPQPRSRNCRHCRSLRLPRQPARQPGASCRKRDVEVIAPVANAAGDRRWHSAQQKQYAPLSTLPSRPNVEPLLALRAEINSALAERGIKVSVNDMLIKALALNFARLPQS